MFLITIGCVKAGGDWSYAIDVPVEFYGPRIQVIEGMWQAVLPGLLARLRGEVRVHVATHYSQAEKDEIERLVKERDDVRMAHKLVDSKITTGTGGACASPGSGTT